MHTVAGCIECTVAQYLHVHVIAESNAKEANRDSERVVRLCYYQTSIIRMGGVSLILNITHPYTRMRST